MTVNTEGGGVRGRRPSMRVGAYERVSRGVEIVQAWPRKRGKNLPPKTVEQMEFFRQVQWAFKYTDPEIQIAYREAVAGTPLLPRDLFLMAASGRMIDFYLPDDTRIFSMAQVQDVSNSLDAIGQSAGQMLIRGPARWEPLEPGPIGYVLSSLGPDELPAWAPPSGGGGGEWLIQGQVTIAAPVAQIDFIGLDAADLLIIADGVTKSAAAQIVGRVSTDNGATFYAGATDYQTISSTGTVTNGPNAFGLHATAASGARTGWGFIHAANSDGAPKLMSGWNQGSEVSRLFKASLDPINAIRLLNTPAANFTGGTITILGR